jgi:hypothetical protein
MERSKGGVALTTANAAAASAGDGAATPNFCAGFSFVIFWACPVLPPFHLSLTFRRGAVYISTNQTGRIHWHRSRRRMVERRS